MRASGLLARLALAAGLACALTAGPALAQNTPPGAPAPGVPPAPVPGQPVPGGPLPGAPGIPPPPPPGAERPQPGRLLPESADITYEEATIEGSIIHARNVTVTLGEYTLTGERLDGDFNGELVFTGNPTLTYRSQLVTGDAIRFWPRTRAYRVDNIHTALTPDFLQGRLLSPVYLAGADILGQRGRPIVGDDISLTTCERPNPDYLIRAGQIKVEPGKAVTLKRATLLLWGHRIITLPTIVIPLDRNPRRVSIRHAPQVGRSVDEGWYARTALNYLLADRVPGIFRLDLMEKKGIGTGLDQAWNLAKAAGALALYAIPTGGTTRNFSGRFNNRLRLGGGQFLTTDNDFQNQSYLSLPGTTSMNNRLGFERSLGGSNTNLSVARQSTQSQGFVTHSYTGTLAQAFQFGNSAGLNLNADYSRYSSAGTGYSQMTQQLATRLQANQRASNYLLQLDANRNIPMGTSTAQSFFSGVEKLPELTLSNYRFTQGLLSRLPVNFLVSAGKYTEGSTGFGTTGSTSVATERVVTGVDMQNTHYTLSSSTDLNVSGGFQQYVYGDGAAQYIFRNNTTLTQRWGKHSGLNLNYTYQRPQGGTPFRFDQQGQFHTLNADIGFLDDRRIQLTARVGYDFAQTGFSGLPAQPWQTLSANLLLRPTGWARLLNLVSFDPNTGKMLAITNDIRLRGRSDFSLDLVGRYDPRVHKYGAINGFLNVPIGRWWRVVGLFQYNGYMNSFESRNLQIVRSFDCMEASLTYMDNPFGFRNDRQVFFMLRIKAFPLFQRFGAGQFGQAIDTGVGGMY